MNNVPACLVSGEDLISVLKTATFLMCPHMEESERAPWCLFLLLGHQSHQIRACTLTSPHLQMQSHLVSGFQIINVGGT